MEQRAAADLDGLILGTAIDRGWATDHLPSDENILSAAAANLARLAEDVLEDPNLQRDRFDRSTTKTGRALQLFDCIKAPCTDACSIDQRVPQYMRAVREDRFDDAVAVTRHDNPLAAILGRACHHPCEAPCLRTHLDEPLAIREIKRFIVEHENSVAHDVQVQPGNVRVAIIGGGPCGLSAATFLARAGAAVTIFEARSTTGGMVSGTIPGYRATHGAVERDLLRVSALGVEIHTGQRVGRDISLDRLRAEGFAYLVVATGAQQGLRLGIPGEDAQGVWDGLDFLRAARARRIDSIGGAVGVIGGGDAAMDCARTARRLGASDVSVLYRRTKDQMPAQREEIRGVQEEGIGIHELVVPTSAIAEDGRLTALKCRRARLGDVDASGRRMPVEIVGSDFEIQLGVLIVAIGQRPDLSLFGDDDVAVNSLGYLDVDPKTLETSIANVFAGGDIIGDGPATIVEAVGDGRRIASTILAREGISLESHPLVSPTVDRQDLLTRRARRRFRSPIPELARDGRNGFDEVVQTLTREQAVVEASRCLDCDLLCSTCEWVCPNRAIFTYRITDLPPTVPLLIVRGAAVGVESTERLPIDQEYQVAVIADLCNECGNCTTFCPTSGRPYRDKPRLFTHRDDFLAESENAFLVNRRENEWTVQSKVGGALHELVFTDRLRYATEHLTVDLDPATFEMLQASVTKKTATTTVALRDCIAMWAILRGLINSMPWMPAAATPDQPMLDT
jgi:putative selenate reductase